MAELADAPDSKSGEVHSSCGFDPHLGHQSNQQPLRIIRFDRDEIALAGHLLSNLLEGRFLPSSPFLRNVVFPTDFSASSEATISHVEGLARAVNAKVWLLNVVPSLMDWHGPSEDYFGPFTGNALIRLESERKTLETGRLERLRCLQKEHFGDLESEITVKSGGVAESIVDHAVETNADLIMIPTRGLGLMRRFLIGSIAAKVLHDAPCAVWTSPHPRELDPFRPYRHILLAIDYQSPSVEFVARALQFAEYFNARISVVGALPGHSGHGDELAQKHQREMAEAVQSRLATVSPNLPVQLLQGSPGEVVRQVAEIDEADLVITGRGHMEESMGRLLTHIYEIIWFAPCPVIVLRSNGSS